VFICQLKVCLEGSHLAIDTIALLHFTFFRDVERVMMVMEWFQGRTATIHEHLKRRVKNINGLSDLKLSEVLAIGVAYYVRLDERQYFLGHICPHLKEVTPSAFKEIIRVCQLLFVEHLELEDKSIFFNQALRENVW